MIAAQKIFSVIDHEPTINKSKATDTMLESVTGLIRMSNVDFSYPSRPDMPILKNFSLIINPGMSVAIVGTSGCGKSTVVSLIERFYDPKAGNIFSNYKLRS